MRNYVRKIWFEPKIHKNEIQKTKNQKKIRLKISKIYVFKITPRNKMLLYKFNCKRTFTHTRSFIRRCKSQKKEMSYVTLLY